MREVVTDEDHKYLSFGRSPPPRSTTRARVAFALPRRKKRKEKKRKERERERERERGRGGSRCRLFGGVSVGCSWVLSVKQNEERKKENCGIIIAHFKTLNTLLFFFLVSCREARLYSCCAPSYQNLPLPIERLTYMSSVQVSNISPSAQESDLTDFFSTAGDIEKLVVKDGLNNTKRATIDFKEKEAVSAALLLNGCLLLNHALCIEEIAYPSGEMEDVEALKKRAEGRTTELSKGESIASGILAKTITLSKQAGQAIKQFDEQHKISETVVSKTNTAYKNVDEKLHLTETTATMKVKISEESQKLDEKFKVSATAGAAGEVVKNTSSDVVSKMNENQTMKKATTAVSNAFSFLSQKATAIVSKAVADSEKEMPSTKATTDGVEGDDSSPKSTVPEAQKA